MKTSVSAHASFGSCFSAEAGVNKGNVDSVLNMLSNQTVSVHFNLYCAGCIPQLEKQQLESKVKLLSQLDTKHVQGKMTELLEALQQDKKTETSVLNQDTMMNAFDNYLNMASGGD